VPLPPTNIQLTQKNSTSASISWNASEGIDIYYKIVTTSTQTSNYSSTSITLNSLLPSTLYKVSIYAGVNNPIGGNETYETAGI